MPISINEKYKVSLFYLCILSCTCFALFTIFIDLNKPQTYSGARDFIQYKSAYELASTGQNPYSPQLLQDAQVKLGSLETLPRMYWSPPWGLLPMLPALKVSSYEDSLMIWRVMSLILLFLSGLLLWTSSREIPPLYIVFGLSTASTLDLLRQGQSSAVILFAFSLALYFIKMRRELYAGLSLSILTIKPHLVFLIWVFLFWSLVRGQRVKVVLGLIMGLSFFLAASEVVFPGSVADWLATFQFNESADNVIPRASWRNPTLGSVSRLLFFEYSAIGSILVPGMAGIILLWWLMHREFECSQVKLLVILTALSLPTAPYGWYYDQILLVPFIMLLCSRVENLNGPNFGVIALFLGSFLFYICGVRCQHQFWWITPSWIVLWLIIPKMLPLKDTL